MQPRATLALEFDDRRPRALRALWVAAGLFAIGAPTWELGPGLWPPSALTLFLGVIVAGGWAVGSAFVYAGLWGEEVALRVERGRIEVVAQTAFGDTVRVVDAHEVGDVRVVRVERDGGDVFRVEIGRLGGPPLVTPAYATEAAAADAAAAITAQLRG